MTDEVEEIQHRSIRIYEAKYRYKANDDFVEFTKNLWNPSKQVWVRISDPTAARYGSIGIAVPAGFDNADRTGWYSRPTKTSHYYYRSTDIDESVTVYFHDKGIKVSISTTGFEWLPDYTGPQVFKFESKEHKPKYVFTDIMGDVIELGDFISYTNSYGNMSFGYVTKISKVGMIYATSMKTEKNRHSYETRLKTGDQCCRMTKDIFNRLMLMKLAL